MFSSFSLLLLIAASAVQVFAFDNKIYLIRHGEKPADGGNGLSSQGVDRSQCLRNVFGASSGYSIGYIITQDYNSDGSRERPFETVSPLAADLGLTIDHHCDRDDTDCATSSIDDYAQANAGNILVCWEHDALSDIGDALGGKFTYPSADYNLIYEIVQKDLTSNSPFSEDCPGLDD
ncbi:hypothetical protein CBS101457_004482 [Exobasidium rhododendri]|nr:hypothetical protein CBS101457_004482 [Exobasidium rhododendri]